MLKLNAKTATGDLTIEVPSCWQEVTVHQFQRMCTEWNGEDEIKLFSIFSGIDSVAIAGSKDFQLEATLHASVRFVFEEPFDFEKLPLPEFVNFAWTVQLPKKIEKLSIGQNIQARKALESVGNPRAAISMVTAIYLQPLYNPNGKLDHNHVLILEKELLKLPIVKIFPIGFFLLRRLNESGNPLLATWQRIKRILNARQRKPHKSNVLNRLPI